MSSDPVRLNVATVPPENDNLNYFKITAGEPGTHSVVVTHGGIAQNRPETYKNNLMLWPGSGPNLATNPIHTQAIEGDQQPDRTVFEFTFPTQNFYLSYQVGEAASTMCAIAPLGGFPLEASAATVPMNVSMDIYELTTGYVKIIYTTLQGYNPTQYKNWVGLWGGVTTPYTTSPPLASAPVTGGQAAGLIELEYEFVPTLSYTLGYFMGPVAADYSHTNAGAMLAFTAQPASG